MTRYAIFGNGRRVLFVKGEYFWMTRSPFSVIIAGASALRYGYSGWGFRISESVCPETPGEQDCLVTSILPWEV